MMWHLFIQGPSSAAHNQRHHNLPQTDTVCRKLVLAAAKLERTARLTAHQKGHENVYEHQVEQDVEELGHMSISSLGPS